MREGEGIGEMIAAINWVDFPIGEFIIFPFLLFWVVALVLFIPLALVHAAFPKRADLMWRWFFPACGVVTGVIYLKVLLWAFFS